MAPPKQQPPERITVDGVDYIWSVRRAPQYSPQHGWVGLVITVEPIISATRTDVKNDPDGWTLRTEDGSLSAHYEHTMVVTRGLPLLLTAC